MDTETDCNATTISRHQNVTIGGGGGNARGCFRTTFWGTHPGGRVYCLACPPEARNPMASAAERSKEDESSLRAPPEIVHAADFQQPLIKHS